MESAALPPVPPDAGRPAGDDKIWTIGCHLSLLLGVGFLLPFIVYLAKRHDAPAVAAHAREALNFHLSLALYSLFILPLIFFLIGIPLFILLMIGSVILAVIAALEASKGGFFHYPLCIPFVR